MLRGVAQRSVRGHFSKVSRRFSSSDGQSMKVPLENSGGHRIGRKLFMLVSGSLLASGGVLVYASKNDRVREFLEANIPNSKELIDGAGSFSLYVQDLYNKVSPTTKPADVSQQATGKEVVHKAAEVLPDVKPAIPAADHLKEDKHEQTVKKDEQRPVATSAAVSPTAPVKKSIDALLSQALSDIDRAIIESKKYIDAICANALAENGTFTIPKDESRSATIALVDGLVQELRADISHSLADEGYANKEHVADCQQKLNNAIRDLNLVTLEVEAFKVYAQNYTDALKKELDTKSSGGVPEDVFLPLDKAAVDGKLSNKELNQFIAFGYRKLRFLQEELAKHDSAARQALQVTMNGQRAELEKVLATKFSEDLAVLEKELKDSKEKELAQAELRLHEIHNDQLARQASAHSQHLQEVLESQERLLRAKFESSVQELLAMERAKFRHELAGLITRVTAIRKVLQDRAEIDRLTSKSHQLWIASQALHDELFSGDSTKEKIIVRPFLSAIQSSFGDDPFVATLVSQFNGWEGEVPSHAHISDRFSKVRRVCRRVAAVPDPPTFTAYIWSYLRSVFILDPPPLPVLVDNDGSKYIEGGEIPDTVAILATAQQLLDNNELELCVRLMNQLSGEAKNVARDWLAEARKLLELRQASSGLLAFAAANSAVGFLTYKGIN